mmetsp:Transcript_22018/g.24469  ORF Transcript_22018/g.24469 Transcript_22018/m.24469 type:complete len:379 (+) Transcript_22018:26-1162(+)|eukprot:CAMPEP_0205830576 /NCGR_PEP_ID=MMETSP0206-20130828/41451_1 /ASSEMBLY_ACC=CAM_ASM_000279 /TAXON_ID=36767 /ORGANISM="Euplotes focardii, Strain TN1" /LENGTH=378 /DNA_ID=CAMNT_0053134371 /DNA_START=26 /DNA_END=1162 /DNA_ORIENTATION=-
MSGFLPDWARAAPEEPDYDEVVVIEDVAEIETVRQRVLGDSAPVAAILFTAIYAGEAEDAGGTNKAVTALADALRGEDPASATVRSLAFENAFLPRTAYPSLLNALMPGLTILDVSGAGSSELGGLHPEILTRCVLEPLRAGRLRLQALSLSNIGAYWPALPEAVAVAPSLLSLRLISDGVCDDQGEQVPVADTAQLIQLVQAGCAGGLVSLELRAVGGRDKRAVCIALADELRTNSTLMHVDLAETELGVPGVGNDGLTALVEVLEDPACLSVLSKVNLGTDDNFDELDEGMVHRLALRLGLRHSARVIQRAATTESGSALLPHLLEIVCAYAAEPRGLPYQDVDERTPWDDRFDSAGWVPARPEGGQLYDYQHVAP